MLLVVLCIWIEAWGAKGSVGEEARVYMIDKGGYNLFERAKFYVCAGKRYQME